MTKKNTPDGKLPKKRKKRASRAKRAIGLPKGAYRVPSGGYVLSRSKDEEIVYPPGTPNSAKVRVTAVFKEKPDLQRLVRALVTHAVYRDLARSD